MVFAFKNRATFEIKWLFSLLEKSLFWQRNNIKNFLQSSEKNSIYIAFADETSYDQDI